MTLKDKLDKFRESYSGTRVTQYDDCLVYSVAALYSGRAAERASRLIDELHLDLVAIPKTEYPWDSFVIQQKK